MLPRSGSPGGLEIGVVICDWKLKRTVRLKLGLLCRGEDRNREALYTRLQCSTNRQQSGSSGLGTLASLGGAIGFAKPERWVAG